MEPLPALGITEREFSKAKHYLVGPSVELYLPMKLSIEADGLYRREDITREFPAILQGGSREFGVWEIPTLAKYRLSSSLLSHFSNLDPHFAPFKAVRPSSDFPTLLLDCPLRVLPPAAGYQ